MRKDFMCLYISFVFSILIACPAFFRITSSAFSPTCLYMGNYVTIQTLKATDEFAGDTNTNLVAEEMTIAPKSGAQRTQHH